MMSVNVVYIRILSQNREFFYHIITVDWIINMTYFDLSVPDGNVSWSRSLPVSSSLGELGLAG